MVTKTTSDNDKLRDLRRLVCLQGSHFTECDFEIKRLFGFWGKKS